MTDVRAILALARQQQAKADFRDAERNLFLALEAASQIYADPGLVAEALQMLVAFYRETRQLNEAVAQATWAAEILKGKLGTSHPGLVPVYRALSDLLKEDGQGEEADRYLGLAREAGKAT